MHRDKGTPCPTNTKWVSFQGIWASLGGEPCSHAPPQSHPSCVRSSEVESIGLTVAFLYVRSLEGELLA